MKEKKRKKKVKKNETKKQRKRKEKSFFMLAPHRGALFSYSIPLISTVLYDSIIYRVQNKVLFFSSSLRMKSAWSPPHIDL